MEEHMVKRFEEAFGPVNRNYPLAGHTFSNLNSLNLDSSLNEVLQGKSRAHLVSMTELEDPVILLTHLPMHKPPGCCSDSPHIQHNWRGHVEYQNFLSENETKFILENVCPYLIFTGHDHVGCDYLHALPVNSKRKDVFLENGRSVEGVSEHTVRSVMGEYSGNVGLFEIRKKSSGGYEYAFSNCSFVKLQYLSVLFITTLVWICIGLLISIFKLCLRCIKKQKQKIP
eukprot:TRINITY_DN9310_c0_g1_i1.p1 TRINITY_DN9310_c0_g1~~TRINITY_DN9310_c0_g1_i1.p1  ORF type:complete len:228 (+),score=49.89 TRINITY_DN9310_c0_g1_i1:464-1147(+)